MQNLALRISSENLNEPIKYPQVCIAQGGPQYSEQASFGKTHLSLTGGQIWKNAEFSVLIESLAYYKPYWKTQPFSM